jgi:CDP-diacylglycerol--glycerol-3-phosphate 3-phosphatidyltransferase
MGKVKTAVQGVALSWALLPLHVLIGLEPWIIVTTLLMIVVLILTVASGIDYIVAQVRGSRQSS